MRTMRYALAVVLVALAASPVAAQTSLQLRWELKEDVFRGADEGASRVAFTLTNRDTKPLPARGWAIYFNALHEPQRGNRAGRGRDRGA